MMKMKVYEIGCKDHGYDVGRNEIKGWEVWIAIPEGCNMEMNGPSNLECRFVSQEECDTYGKDMMRIVDCIVHKDVAS